MSELAAIARLGADSQQGFTSRAAGPQRVAALEIADRTSADPLGRIGARCLSVPVVSSETPGSALAYLFADLNERLIASSIIVYSPESSSRSQDDPYRGLHSQLNALSALHDGWDGYDAPAPNLAASRAADAVLRVLAACSPVVPAAVVPSAEGGVGIVFSGPENKYADIECLNTGDTLAVVSDRINDPEAWAVGSESPIRDTIERIASFLNL